MELALRPIRRLAALGFRVNVDFDTLAKVNKWVVTHRPLTPSQPHPLPIRTTDRLHLNAWLCLLVWHDARCAAFVCSQR